jgi:hypothetical protein
MQQGIQIQHLEGTSGEWSQAPKFHHRAGANPQINYTHGVLSPLLRLDRIISYVPACLCWCCSDAKTNRRQPHQWLLPQRSRPPLQRRSETERVCYNDFLYAHWPDDLWTAAAMEHLPQELIDAIIDQFAPHSEAATPDGPDRYYVSEPQAAALMACALTSRSFYHGTGSFCLRESITSAIVRYLSYFVWYSLATSLSLR